MMPTIVSKEKNVGRAIVIFVLLFVAFYLGLSVIVHRCHWSGRRLALHLNPLLARMGGQEALMTRDWDPTLHWDVLVVGSSHAYRGYDPRFFRQRGVLLFNAGSSAQHPMVSLEVLQSFLGETKQKPLIIIDVFDKILEMDGKESTGRMMLNARQWAIANGIMARDGDVLALNNYLGRCLANHDELEMEVKDYVESGYCERIKVLEQRPEPVHYAFEGNEHTLKQFDECLNWLEQEHYSFVLVSHPMPRQEGFENYHAPAAQRLHQMAKAHHAVFLDYTTRDQFSERLDLFSDATHLNQTGVETFNRMVLDTLLDLGMVKPVEQAK